MTEAGPGPAPSPGPAPGSHGRDGAGKLGKGAPHLVALIVGLALTLLALSVLLFGPASYRMGVLDVETATAGVAAIALWIVVGGAGLMIVALIACIMQRKPRGVILSIVGLVAAAEIGFNIYSFQALRAAAPPIHDVQTDWSHPVAFSERLLRDREAAGAVAVRDDARLTEAGPWAGKTVAEVQAEAYDLKPLLVGVVVPDATVAVEHAAKRLDWLIMMSDPQSGELEAVHYSPWYGLGSDIAVRVLPQGAGSRIDVRSTSRTAGTDMGANNQRVTELLREVEFALRGRGAPGPGAPATSSLPPPAAQ